MTLFPSPPPDESDSPSVWRDRVVPTAQALEGFFWRVAWFAVVVRVFLVH